jgi:hypothetical protein
MKAKANMEIELDLAVLGGNGTTARADQQSLLSKDLEIGADCDLRDVKAPTQVGNAGTSIFRYESNNLITTFLWKKNSRHARQSCL